MLELSIAFYIAAIPAVVIAFSGFFETFAAMGRIAFFVFIVGFIVSLIAAVVRGPKRHSEF